MLKSNPPPSTPGTGLRRPPPTHSSSRAEAFYNPCTPYPELATQVIRNPGQIGSQQKVRHAKSEQIGSHELDIIHAQTERTAESTVIRIAFHLFEIVET